MKLTFTTTNQNSERLDRVMLQDAKVVPQLAELSRSQLKNLIEAGKVQVNGVVQDKAGTLVKAASLIEVDFVLAPSHIEPSSHELDILFEDDVLLVVNKPPGLAMHPGAGRKSDTLANAIAWRIKAAEFPAGVRPGIVHRLDMDTSGIVVVAKTLPVHAALSKQFADKTTERKYLALVYSTPRARRAIMTSESGRIETALGRHPQRRKEFAVVTKGGKKSATNWSIVERMPYAALVELVLETGRTHQIRVHMNHIGSPVIGDRVYGDFSGLPKELGRAASEFGRQALHAGSLGFTHPVSGKRLTFSAPPPADLVRLAEVFRKWR